MKKLVLLGSILCLFEINSSNAQQLFKVPQNVILNVKEDYAKYEKDIIKATDWIINTPLNEHSEYRKEVYEFLMKWIMGAPKLTVELSDFQTQYLLDNPDLMMIYLASYTKNALKSNYKSTVHANTKQALLDVLKVYNKGIKIVNKPTLDQLNSIVKDNQLDAHIKQNLESK